MEFGYREKEGNINDFRIAKGLTFKELGALVGMNPSQITDLNSGKETPLRTCGKNKGMVKDKVLQLCKVLDATPEELFPRYFCTIKRNELSPDDLIGLTYGGYIDESTMDPADIYERKEALEHLLEVGGLLSEKGRAIFVLKTVYDFSFEELGEMFDCTKQYANVLTQNCTDVITQRVRIYEEPI